MTGLTTHVLDTARGGAASGMQVELRHEGELVHHITLDAGGRATLLSAEQLHSGAYELWFHAGDYQAQYGGARFFDIIPVHFNITDPTMHYHIPLILSPFGYSTYRGG